MPKEGALIWFDSFAIPADAPHKDEAAAFINFMLDPKIAARNSDYVAYASGSKDAQALMNKDILEDKEADAEMTKKKLKAGIKSGGVPLTDIRGTLIHGAKMAELEKVAREAGLLH